MEIKINIKKGHFQVLLIVFLVGIFSFYVIGYHAGGFDPNAPTHELVQIINNSGASVDQDEDGVIDMANMAEVANSISGGEALNKFSFDVSNNDTTTWECVTVDLKEYCGDFDGCSIRLLMQHEIDSWDKVLIIDEHIYMEQDSFSNNNGAGKYGWTRQSGGGDHSWITGMTNRYEMFSPWGWAWMHNYRHNNCIGQSGHGPPYSYPYNFTFMSHAYVKTKVIVTD